MSQSHTPATPAPAVVTPTTSATGMTRTDSWTDIVVSFDGAPVYAKRRPGTGNPVVFLHGYGDYGDCWQGLLARLPSDLDATLADSLGHGHSGYPASGCDAVARRDAVVQLLREHIGPAVLVGHSMGAATALAVAAVEPTLVAGLVLEDPPWWLDEIARRPVSVIRIARSESLVQWIEGLQRRTVADVTASCRADHPDWDEVEFEHWARSKLRVDLSGVDLPYREIAESVLEQWQQVRCPALLVTGDPAKSGIVTDELAQQFLTCVAGAERSHHPACGHDIRRDDPAGVAAAITDFLAALGAPAAASA
ncbi:MAG: alpha/beta hydrolase [Actinomycetales bacterium]|nr:alpha/beta hydrolase [Actinomycetales bacterium]